MLRSMFHLSHSLEDGYNASLQHISMLEDRQLLLQSGFGKVILLHSRYNIVTQPASFPGYKNLGTRLGREQLFYFTYSFGTQPVLFTILLLQVFSLSAGPQATAVGCHCV